MPTPSEGTGGRSDSVAVTVRVFRILSGMNVRVRLLSPRYGGCFTHWRGGRSRYCPGEAGKCPNHKLDKQWKGYGAIQYYDPHADLWIPSVLELTEHAELDFRNVWKRGQYWDMKRPKDVESKKFPVTAKLAHDGSGLKVPDSFNYLPVLLTMYHQESIELNVPNPIPPKVILEASHNGTTPPAVKPQETIPTKEEWMGFREKMKLMGFKLPDRDQAGE